LDLKAAFFSATEASKFLEKNTVDLIFLDINMPEISGLDFSQILPKSIAVIFTTAYSEYAVDAFKLNALDYLLKPIDFGRFVQACNKAKKSLQKDELDVDHIFVKDGYDWVRVWLPDLHYVQSDGNYLTFFESSNKVMTRMTMKEAVGLLPKNFLRIHKSNLVNLSKIKKVERHQVTLTNNMTVPISSGYGEAFLDEIKKNGRVK
jgi:two-component system, LytTR family, response regulator